jgi:hypothetical protein
MLTAFLWTTLILSSLLLFIIAPPIRATVKIRYNKPQKAEYEIWGSYIHPVIFKYEYSSAKEKGSVKILGREWGKGDRAYRGDSQCGMRNEAEWGGISTKSGGDGEIRAKHTVKEEVKKDILGDDRVDVKTGISEDNSTKAAADVKPVKPKKASIIERIKMRIESIKNHKVYKIINDKPLRKKIFGWLRRAFFGLFKLISFDKFKLRAAVGYPDPAALGKFYGYFIAARSALELQKRPFDLSMEPVFTEKCLRIDAEMVVKTSLSVILWYALILAATFPYWRVYRLTKGKKLA